ncbi:hypothetical protein K504DRAFT_208399 [Pleomassaria siparia CBS 279.74]|uniref:Uncharacterized protein n=1 Tax=Pleomassaria siparia CBS 279.74 TaxID=1314801 RepID=A0A6G1KJD3_9PLEO|nr:hypothetical protein K504DRAFT_208399 [Pleomassaria siparia CBS 279.74]
MEGVPSPLRVGTPTMARRPSTDHHPALRVGSPVVERGTPSPFSRPPLAHRDTSGSNRISQLFPSRPLSAASVSPADTPGSRRLSYPSPLIPAAEPTYRIPRAPDPPSFSNDTSYNPIQDAADRQGSQPGLQSSSGKRRLLNRLTSLRSARAKGGDYSKLEDEESTGRLRGVEEIDEPVRYDLSGYEGYPMESFAHKTIQKTADARKQEQSANEASYAAEYERLEAQLGAGMTSVVEVPFTTQTSQPMQRSVTTRATAIHRRGASTDEDVANAAHTDALREAEKTGDIIAVADIPMDLSDFGGAADFETLNVLTPGHTDNDASQTSYFFPPDPDMPAWRPFSMGWPWLSVLVVIAVFLAIGQEVLCQISMKKAKDPHLLGLISFDTPKDLTVLEYFTWKYAPILLFVVYGILWQITDFDVKRLEPFYQLSKKSGATAAQSLNMDYLSFMSWLVPLRALRHKQYAVIYSSLGTLLASSLVPVLQSASVIMYPPASERNDGEKKAIRIDPPWSRAVSGALMLIAICGSILIYAMRRKSGLLSDPKGIAGIAAMATKSHILTDFGGLDTAPLDKIHKQLRYRRYILHKSALWQGEYIRNSTEKLHEHGSDPRPLMLRLRAGVPYICFIIIFTVSIPVFLFVEEAKVVTEKLPFLLTALATIVKILWGTMNCDLRMLEPYWILAQRRAPAKTLTLDYTGTNPFFLPVKAFLNKHYLVAIVGIGSILTEILTVCVSSFSVDGKKFIPGKGGCDLEHRPSHEDKRRGDENQDDHNRCNTDETFRSFWISFALVIGILLILVAIASIVYMRRSHKFMPRQVGTMASVLAFIHQSKMLVNFVDTAELSSDQMTFHLGKQGKTYSLGWFNGRDHEDHCGIDEEPMMASYKYGEDRTKVRVMGNQIGTWEHYETL